MTDRPALLIMQRHLAPLTAFLESAYDVYIGIPLRIEQLVRARFGDDDDEEDFAPPRPRTTGERSRAVAS